jgi:hypothetical protein
MMPFAGYKKGTGKEWVAPAIFTRSVPRTTTDGFAGQEADRG